MFTLLANQSIPKNVCSTSMENATFAKFKSIVADEDSLDADGSHEEETAPTAYVPVDWSLKLKLRILSNVQIPGGRLKSSEEASGITG